MLALLHSKVSTKAAGEHDLDLTVTRKIPAVSEKDIVYTYAFTNKCLLPT